MIDQSISYQSTSAVKSQFSGVKLLTNSYTDLYRAKPQVWWDHLHTLFQSQVTSVICLHCKALLHTQKTHAASSSIHTKHLYVQINTLLHMAVQQRHIHHSSGILQVFSFRNVCIYCQNVEGFRKANLQDNYPQTTYLQHNVTEKVKQNPPPPTLQGKNIAY